MYSHFQALCYIFFVFDILDNIAKWFGTEKSLDHVCLAVNVLVCLLCIETYYLSLFYHFSNNRTKKVKRLTVVPSSGLKVHSAALSGPVPNDSSLRPNLNYYCYACQAFCSIMVHITVYNKSGRFSCRNNTSLISDRGRPKLASDRQVYQLFYWQHWS